MELAKDILNGIMDEELRSIRKAINNRMAYLNKQRSLEALSEIKIGDLVRILDIRPKYLTGLKGRVQEVNHNNETIGISLTQNSRLFARKFKDTTILSVPSTCLKVIEIALSK